MTRRPPDPSPHRLSPRRLRPVLWVFIALVVVAPGAGLAVPAGAVTKPECEPVITELKSDLATLAPADGAKKPTAEDIATLQVKAAGFFKDAAKQNPECTNDISLFQAQLVANAKKAVQIKGTPFWGPIGWAWNNVYYKVFSGNDIMMGMFGWALMLSPFILAFSLVWVLRGSTGAFHRPYVPPHLKTER